MDNTNVNQNVASPMAYRIIKKKDENVNHLTSNTLKSPKSRHILKKNNQIWTSKNFNNQN